MGEQRVVSCGWLSEEPPQWRALKKYHGDGQKWGWLGLGAVSRSSERERPRGPGRRAGVLLMRGVTQHCNRWA